MLNNLLMVVKVCERSSLCRFVSTEHSAAILDRTATQLSSPR